MDNIKDTVRAYNPLNDYTEELIEYLDEAGIEPDDIERVEEGDLVETYILEIDGRKEVFQYTDESINELVRGSRTYELLEGEIPVPEVRDRRVGEGYAWHRVSMVEGEPPGDEEEMRRYGEAVGLLHSIDVPRQYGHLRGMEGEGFETETGDTAWQQHLGQQLVWRANMLSDTPYLEDGFRERLLDLWSEGRDSVPDSPENAVLHGDLALENALVGESGTALIDFDMAALGDPDLEFMRVKNDRLRFGEMSEPFLEGYTEVRDVPGMEPEREQVYRIASALANLQAIKFLEDNRTISFDQEDVEKENRELEEAMNEFQDII